MDNEYCQKWGLNAALLPRHVGIIMDGNGRWATQKKLPRIAGHTKGVDRVQEITELSGNLGIQALTIYAFSDENWRRPEEEVSGIMSLLRWFIRKERKRIIENNVQFRVIGDRQKLSSDIINLIFKLEKDTQGNNGMHLCVALSYGAHGEILRATKRLYAKIQANEIYLNDIDEHAFEACLDTHALPPLDMFIRTSGEYRVSNFLLWQLAYAEMFFTPTLWPDFSSTQFVSLLKDFAARERRFGMTSAQVRADSQTSSASGSL